MGRFMVSRRIEVNGAQKRKRLLGCQTPAGRANGARRTDAMPDRPNHRPGSRGKPGATHEQTERRERFGRARRDSLRPADEVAVLYGWHTVKAALENPERRIRKLLATENAARRLAEEHVPTKPQP